METTGQHAVDTAPPGEALDKFYRDLMHELSAWMGRATASPQGVPIVVKRVALEHGIASAERLPLPRLSRAQEAALGIGRAGDDPRRWGR